MCNRSNVIGLRMLAAMAAVIALAVIPASAEPLSFSMVLQGNGPATIQPGFEGVFVSSSDFSVGFDGFNVLQLNPGFCIDECGTGTSVSFTQTIQFDGRDRGTLTSLSGNLTFTGPTETIVVNSPFSTTGFTEPVAFSGILEIAQPNQVLFRQRVSGSGMGSVSYETDNGVTQLQLFQYQVNGTAVTPEPASAILLGTGLVWLAIRKRRNRVIG